MVVRMSIELMAATLWCTFSEYHPVSIKPAGCVPVNWVGRLTNSPEKLDQVIPPNPSKIDLHDRRNANMSLLP